MSYIYLINENQLFEFRSCSLVLDTKFQELLFNNRGIPIRVISIFGNIFIAMKNILLRCQASFQFLYSFFLSKESNEL